MTLEAKEKYIIPFNNVTLDRQNKTDQPTQTMQQICRKEYHKKDFTCREITKMASNYQLLNKKKEDHIKTICKSN